MKNKSIQLIVSVGCRNEECDKEGNYAEVTMEIDEDGAFYSDSKVVSCPNCGKEISNESIAEDTIEVMNRFKED